MFQAEGCSGCSKQRGIVQREVQSGKCLIVDIAIGAQLLVRGGTSAPFLTAGLMYRQYQLLFTQIE